MDEEQSIKPETEQSAPDSRHEPHEHASRRIWIGVGAVLLIGIASFVWANWGEEIKKACLGETACTIELYDTPDEGSTFAIPDPEAFSDGPSK